MNAGDVLHSPAKAEDQGIRTASKFIKRQWHNATTETSSGYINSSVIWVNVHPQGLSFPTCLGKGEVRPVLTFLEPKCGAESIRSQFLSVSKSLAQKVGCDPELALGNKHQQKWSGPSQ